MCQYQVSIQILQNEAVGTVHCGTHAMMTFAWGQLVTAVWTVSRVAPIVGSPLHQGHRREIAPGNSRFCLTRREAVSSKVSPLMRWWWLAAENNTTAYMLPLKFMKSRSHKIGYQNDRIYLKCVMRCSAELPVKFGSDQTTIKPHLFASRFREIWWAQHWNYSPNVYVAVRAWHVVSQFAMFRIISTWFHFQNWFRMTFSFMFKCNWH